MSIDLVLGCHRKQNYNSNFREVQNPISISISPVLERFNWFLQNFTYCSEIWSARRLLFLRETGSECLTLEVCMTLILAVSQLRLSHFSCIVTKLRTAPKIISFDFVLGG